MLDGIRASSNQCNSSVVIPDIQIVTSNTYNTTPNVVIQNGYVTGPDSIYIAASDGGSTAIFTKQNFSGDTEWAKSYSNFPYYHQSFVVAGDDSGIFVVEEGSTSRVNILKINPGDGSLMTQYIE